MKEAPGPNYTPNTQSLEKVNFYIIDCFLSMWEGTLESFLIVFHTKLIKPYYKTWYFSLRQKRIVFFSKLKIRIVYWNFLTDGFSKDWVFAVGGTPLLGSALLGVPKLVGKSYGANDVMLCKKQKKGSRAVSAFSLQILHPHHSSLRHAQELQNWQPTLWYICYGVIQHAGLLDAKEQNTTEQNRTVICNII